MPFPPRPSRLMAGRARFPLFRNTREPDMDGMILKIDRCSKHDGPGIRTVVFMKGCPLRCLWCSTPESQSDEPQLLHMETLCALCGRCATNCAKQALTMAADGVLVDHAACTLCGRCVEVCPKHAMKIAGSRMSVEEVYAIVDRSRPFWVRMTGGLTISGGEVLHQFEFARALLQKCHDSGIDTNIETSCYAEENRIRGLLPHLDHVCIDIKHMDDAAHREYTGISNRRILENIRMLSHEKDLILRFPVIPHYNDSPGNIDAIADFVGSLGPKFNRIDLLPYHVMGSVTYRRLGLPYKLEGIPAMPREQLAKIRDSMRARGVNAVMA